MTKSDFIGVLYYLIMLLHNIVLKSSVLHNELSYWTDYWASGEAKEERVVHDLECIGSNF